MQLVNLTEINLALSLDEFEIFITIVLSLVVWYCVVTKTN